MRRGDLYRAERPNARTGDPRSHRVVVVVSRQALVDSRFSSVVVAPVYSRHDGLASQVTVDEQHGLKHPSSIHCDELVSLPKAALTHYIGALSEAKVRELDDALHVALGLLEDA